MFASSLLVAQGCLETELELPPEPKRGGPEPVLPSASTARATPPSWIERLPPVQKGATSPVAAGAKVWAATGVGTTAMVDVGLYTVSGVYDGLYALTGRTGQEVDRVHPLLVHATKPIPRLRANTTVLFYTPTTPAFLGRLGEVVGGAALEIRYDLGGVTAKTEADHVELPVTGVAPMAYVAFPKAGAMSRGLVVAVTEAQVWLRTASGHLEVHDRARVEALPLPPAKVAVGEKVRAFRWATGFQEGVVTKVLEDGLRYEVKRDERRTAEYFFSSVLKKKR